MYDIKLYLTLTYFRFCGYWIISISAFTFAVGLKICTITLGNEKYNSIINKKKKKKYDEILLLPKTA